MLLHYTAFFACRATTSLVSYKMEPGGANGQNAGRGKHEQIQASLESIDEVERTGAGAALRSQDDGLSRAQAPEPVRRALHVRGRRVAGHHGRDPRHDQRPGHAEASATGALRLQDARYTNPRAWRIGERSRPEPHGRPGYLRVDTVHQEDQDGIKGVYHTTQWTK
jgi:hypothetical protein